MVHQQGPELPQKATPVVASNREQLAQEPTGNPAEAPPRYTDRETERALRWGRNKWRKVWGPARED
jgi:hypothetical protein